MISGVVSGSEAIIRIKVRGPLAREEEIEAVVDTGYTAWLSLPPALISSLELAWKGIEIGVLANGDKCQMHVHIANVVWDHRTISILVAEADAVPLVGMSLLDGYELKMQVREGGKVTIKRLH